MRVTRGAFRKSPACSKRAHQFSQLHLIAQRWKPPEMEHNSSNNKGNKNVANKTKPTSKSLNLQFCSTLLAGCRHSSSLMMAQIVLLSARQLFIFCDAPPSPPSPSFLMIQGKIQSILFIARKIDATANSRKRVN